MCVCTSGRVGNSLLLHNPPALCESHSRERGGGQNTHTDSERVPRDPHSGKAGWEPGVTATMGVPAGPGGNGSLEGRGSGLETPDGSVHGGNGRPRATTGLQTTLRVSTGASALSPRLSSSTPGTTTHGASRSFAAVRSKLDRPSSGSTSAALPAVYSAQVHPLPLPPSLPTLSRVGIFFAGTFLQLHGSLSAVESKPHLCIDVASLWAAVYSSTMIDSACVQMCRLPSSVHVAQSEGGSRGQPPPPLSLPARSC